VFLAWAGRWLTSLGFGLIINFLLLLFPDGRLPSAWLAAARLARRRYDRADHGRFHAPAGLARARPDRLWRVRRGPEPVRLRQSSVASERAARHES
jgi:hypothetical protein